MRLPERKPPFPKHPCHSRPLSLLKLFICHQEPNSVFATQSCQVIVNKMIFLRGAKCLCVCRRRYSSIMLIYQRVRSGYLLDDNAPVCVCVFAGYGDGGWEWVTAPHTLVPCSPLSCCHTDHVRRASTWLVQSHQSKSKILTFVGRPLFFRSRGFFLLEAGHS